MSLQYKTKKLYNYLKQCQAQFQTHPQGSQSGVWIQPAGKNMSMHICVKKTRIITVLITGKTLVINILLLRKIWREWASRTAASETWPSKLSALVFCDNNYFFPPIRFLKFSNWKNKIPLFYFVYFSHAMLTIYQCCGSAFRIRCLFDPGSGISFFRAPDVGSQTHIFDNDKFLGEKTYNS